MSLPLVSVLLPFYNESIDFAQQSIDSIVNQSYSNLEILLLLDNPQNENLKSFLESCSYKDKRIRLLINERNLGLPLTLNRGIEEAGGEYIARMDGDDISSPERLSVQVKFLLENPGVDLVGSDAEIIDEAGTRIGVYSKLKTDRCQKIMLKYGSIDLLHPTWTGKASVFKKLKYRDFQYVEDYDFMLRAAFENLTFANIPSILLKYRIVQTKDVSISRSNAFKQFKNNAVARSLYRQAAKSKVYPEIPIIEYDERDIKKFQNVNYLVNELRTSVNRRNIWKSLQLIIKLLKTDVRPVESRVKNRILKFCLSVIDN